MSEDLRVIKTKRAIKDAFVSLVKEKGYNQVNVKEITDRGQINRNTFYLHYESKEDLVEQLMKDVIFSQSDRLFSVLSKMSKNVYGMKEIVFYLCAKSLLLVLQDEIEFYKVIITDPSLNGYIYRLSKTLKNGLQRVFKLGEEQDDEHLIFEYLFNGLFGLIIYWIKNDGYSLEDTARIMSKCSYENIQMINKIKKNKGQIN